MNKPLVFEKPNGFHDILPGPLRRKGELEERILSLMEKWGYEKIET
ncbi:MAG: ATP phosphoribosyltransferase regulatory subunit, partial [Thermicanus sp.]|nr:ATP phosphoribosyltransferase regulatory subunit [Thermicanus sp.]